jgi:hypothetical protein
VAGENNGKSAPSVEIATIAVAGESERTVLSVAVAAGGADVMIAMTARSGVSAMLSACRAIAP